MARPIVLPNPRRQASMLLIAGLLWGVFLTGAWGQAIPNLLGYWPFDGDARDVSGNGLDATVVGPTQVTGRFGGAYSFGGNAQYISPHTNTILNGASAATISYWVKTTDADAWIACKLYTGPDYDSWTVGIRFGTAYWMFATGPTDTYYPSHGRAVNDDVFHHICVVFGGDFVKVYVDGVLDTETPIAGALLTHPQYLILGSLCHWSDDGPSTFESHRIFDYTGVLDDLAIFDRALLPEEVAALRTDSNGNGQADFWDQALRLGANFSASPIRGAVPLTVQFSDLSTGRPTSWAWDFDNDAVVDSSAQNPSHEYTLPGVYTVKQTVSDADEASDKVKTDYITVLLPVPAITTNAGASYSTNESNLTLQGTCHALTSQIVVNGAVSGVTYSTGQTSWTYSATLVDGPNLLTVQAVDAAGNLSDPATITVTLNTRQIIPSLLGYWPFDGDARDVSGNGLDATVVGPTQVTGRFGGAYSFGGRAHYISPHSNTILSGASAATISYWVKTTDADAMVTCKHYTSPDYDSWWVGIVGGYVNWWFATSSATYNPLPGRAIIFALYSGPTA